MERVQAEHLAGGVHGARDRDRLLAQLDANSGGGGDLVERRGQTAAGRVAEDVDAGASGDDRRYQPVERLSVRSDFDLEVQALADAHDRDAVQADRPGQDHHVAGAGSVRPDRNAVRYQPDTSGVDEDAVRRSPAYHFRVAGHYPDAGPTGRPSDRLGHLPQVLDRQAFLDDIGERQRQRLGAHHGQVVDCAVHRQLADVAAGEFERADHERVGCEGKPVAGDLDHGGVVERT